ncbi:MAG: hypothetical protein SFW67_23370 [Myxococcaceae bacterium]|nr:hypothetical protein [Myxococcaceae bacterium]
MARATDGDGVEVLCEQWGRASGRWSLDDAASALHDEFHRPVLVRERGEWFLASGFVNGRRAGPRALELGDVLEPHAPFSMHGRCWRVAGRGDAALPPVPGVDAPAEAWRVFEDALLERGYEPPSRARGAARLRWLGAGAPLVSSGGVRVSFDENGFVATLTLDHADWALVVGLLQPEPLFARVRAVELVGELPSEAGDEAGLRGQVALAREAGAFPLLARVFSGRHVVEVEGPAVRLALRQVPAVAWAEPAVLDVTHQGHTERHWLGTVDTVWRDVDRGVTLFPPGVPEAMPVMARHRGRWVVLPGREPFLTENVTGALRHGDAWTLADGTALRFLQFAE